MAAASGQHNAANGGSAQQARLTLAAIYSMLELEKSFFSICIDIVGDRRSTERDGLAQHFLYGGVQLGKLLSLDRRRASARPDAGPKQRLVGINVAHAAQQFLIEKSALDGSLTPAKKCDEALLAYLQWLNSTRIEAARMNAQLAKHSWIDKSQLTARSQLRDQVSVLSDFRRWFTNYNTSGHSEMDNPLRGHTIALLCGLPRLAATGASICFRPRRPRFSLQIEHNVLARAVHAYDPLAFERRCDDASRRLERLFPGTDPDRFDAVSGDTLVEAADDRFNFGEFGHAVRIQDRR